VNVWRLAIDYGTSHTVATLGWPDGRTRPLVFDASPLLSSAVFADASGELFVGRDALAGVERDPGRFEPYPKRQVDAGTVLLGDRQVPVADLIAATLRRVAQEAARVAGGAPGEVVLTHPAGWGPTRRALLRAAAANAGLPAPTMLAEPVAAAAYFLNVARSPVPRGAPLLVYDLGGGTFDVSVVRQTAEGFDIVASDGLPDLGGADLDALVVQLIGQTVADVDPQAWSQLTNPTTAADRRGFRALWEAARLAKEALSRHPVATVRVPVVEREVHVTREQFEHGAAPMLALTTDLTQTMLRRTGLGVADLAAVFLVGGASRTPLVATLVHRFTGAPPTILDQPELVVAEGALYSPAPPMSGAPAAAAPTMSGVPAPVAAAPTPPPPAPPWYGVPGTVHSGPPPQFTVHPAPRARRRLGVIGLVVAALVLATGLTVAAIVILRPDSAAQLRPVAGDWEIASASVGWTSTSRSAVMRIDSDGTVTVSGTDGAGYGCTGTIASVGDHKPYKITLPAKCDTGSPAAGSALDATLDSTGGRLTVNTSPQGDGGQLASSEWTREK
jgi:hypothetical protein